MIVLDTSIIIDHLRGVPGAQDSIRHALLDGEALVASVLTKVELLAGRRASEEPALRRAFGLCSWFEVDDDLAESAGFLAHRFARAFPGIDPVDYVIAATAVRLDATLWTRNLKHFPMFPDLKAPY